MPGVMFTYCRALCFRRRELDIQKWLKTEISSAFFASPCPPPPPPFHFNQVTHTHTKNYVANEGHFQDLKRNLIKTCPIEIRNGLATMSL